MSLVNFDVFKAEAVANFQEAARRHSQRLDELMQGSEETNVVAKTIGDYLSGLSVAAEKPGAKYAYAQLMAVGVGHLLPAGISAALVDMTPKAEGEVAVANPFVPRTAPTYEHDRSRLEAASHPMHMALQAPTGMPRSGTHAVSRCCGRVSP
mmetsp:Transcript_18272/g.58983  ORF Transcript_18272/g.58983 Transcript_18272/m.58983 type:complete len:152 (+) Transcript_18272:93-548(+)